MPGFPSAPLPDFGSVEWMEGLQWGQPVPRALDIWARLVTLRLMRRLQREGSGTHCWPTGLCMSLHLGGRAQAAAPPPPAMSQSQTLPTPAVGSGPEWGWARLAHALLWSPVPVTFVPSILGPEMSPVEAAFAS